MTEPARGPTSTQLRTVILVVAILGGIASVLGPRWAKERNERSAVGSLKTIATAQALRRDTARPPLYATLAQLEQAQLIDAVLATGTKDGYVFRAAPSSTTPELLWWASAEPVSPGTTGVRWFFANQAGDVGYATHPLAIDTRTCTSPDAVFIGK